MGHFSFGNATFSLFWEKKGEKKKKKKKEGLNNKRRHRLVSQYLHANIYMQRHGSASSYSYLLKLLCRL